MKNYFKKILDNLNNLWYSLTLKLEGTKIWNVFNVIAEFGNGLGYVVYYILSLFYTFLFFEIFKCLAYNKYLITTYLITIILSNVLGLLTTYYLLKDKNY